MSAKVTISDLKQPTMDFFRNAASGQGTSVDKNYYNEWVTEERIDWKTIDTMYVNNWLAAKCVDAKPNDMIRSWRKVSGLSSKDTKQYELVERFFGLKTKIEEAMKWARLYGGGAIVLGLPGSASSPFDYSKLKKGQLSFMHVFDATECVPDEIDTDPLSANFKHPKYYLIEDVKVHHSRVIPFHGTRLPRRLLPDYNYWGAPIFQKMKEDIERVAVSYGAGSSMLHEASLDIISVEGLFNLIGDKIGESKVMKRLTLSDLTKSSHRALVKDVDEKFEKVTHNFSGVPEMIREMLIAVSGASETPITRLLGISPSGLNATGEHDLVNYYDSVAAEQRLKLEPVLDKLDTLLQLHAFGEVKEDFTSVFNPLWEPTRGQQSEMDYKDVESDLKALSFLPARVVLKRIIERNSYKLSPDEFEEQVTYLEENKEKFLQTKPTMKQEPDREARMPKPDDA